MAGTCFGGTFHRKSSCLVKIDLPSSVPSRARKSSIATTQTACGWSRQSFNDYSQFHLGTFCLLLVEPVSTSTCFPFFNRNLFQCFLHSSSTTSFCAFAQTASKCRTHCAVRCTHFTLCITNSRWVFIKFPPLPAQEQIHIHCPHVWHATKHPFKPPSLTCFSKTTNFSSISSISLDFLGEYFANAMYQIPDWIYTLKCCLIAQFVIVSNCSLIAEGWQCCFVPFINLHDLTLTFQILCNLFVWAPTIILKKNGQLIFSSFLGLAAGLTNLLLSFCSLTQFYWASSVLWSSQH